MVWQGVFGLAMEVADRGPYAGVTPGRRSMARFWPTKWDVELRAKEEHALAHLRCSKVRSIQGGDVDLVTQLLKRRDNFALIPSTVLGAEVVDVFHQEGRRS